MPSDSLRLVSFGAPWFERARPTQLRDLLDGDTHIAEGGSPQLAPGEHETGNITYDSPYAGEFSTLDRHQNSRLSTVLRVMGTDPVGECDRIVAACLAAPPRSAVEWRRDGVGVPTYFPLRGDVNWAPAYGMRDRQQGSGMTVALGFEVAPFVHRGSMDVHDDFAQDSLADYTLLFGSGSFVENGALKSSDATLKRIAHTGRGHRYGDVQVTSEVVFGTTVANFEGPPAVKILDVNNAIWATYEDAFLNIYKMDGGANTLLGSVSVAAPAASSRRWVRLGIEGNVVTAEWWTAQPTPMGAPAQTASHTLTGANATKYGAEVQGQAGIWFWTPHSSLTSYVDSLTIEPYTYRAKVLPEKIVLGGKVPGDIPALCDLQVTHLAGDAAPIYALAGWTPRKTPVAATVAPFAVIEAETAATATFTNGLYGGSRGKSALFVQASGAGTRDATWSVDGAAIAQPGAETVDVEVYARLSLSAPMTGLALVLSSTPWYGTGYGAERFSDRGRAGLLPIMPTADLIWRVVRLGRLTIPANRTKLALTATWTGAASSWLAIDHLFLVPAEGHVSSPRSLPPDASYPKFFPTTSQVTRVARSDGTGQIAVPPEPPVPEHGLGGRIEIGPGDVDLAMWLASMIPGDPTVGATSVQLSHTATVHPVVLPRFHYG